MSKIKPIIEGSVKFRDGKKWKLRYCVLCLPTTSQNTLHLYLGKNYDDFAAHRSADNPNCVPRSPIRGVEGGKTGKSIGVLNSLAATYRCNYAAPSASSGGTSSSSSSGYTSNFVWELCNSADEASQSVFASAAQTARVLNAPAPYDVITGLESGCHLDRESNVMLLIGRATVHAIALPAMEDMFTWAETLKRHLKDSSYHVTLCRASSDSGCKLAVGLQASLHVQKWRVCLIGEPSAGGKFICQWRLDSIDTFYTMEPPPGTSTSAKVVSAATAPSCGGLALTGTSIGSMSTVDGGSLSLLISGLQQSSNLLLSGVSGLGIGLSPCTVPGSLNATGDRNEDLLVLKTNKYAGKVQGNFTFQVDAHRLEELTQAIEELMLRRFLSLSPPAVPPPPSTPLGGLEILDPLVSVGLDTSGGGVGGSNGYMFARKTPSSSSVASLSPATSLSTGGDNSSPLVTSRRRYIVTDKYCGSGCVAIAPSSFPKEGLSNYVNTMPANRSYIGIPANPRSQFNDVRLHLSNFTNTQNVERSDEIIIPRSRLHVSGRLATSVQEDNPGSKDQVYSLRHHQNNHGANGLPRNLNITVGSAGSDCSSRSENEPPPYRKQHSEQQPATIFPSVKVFAGVITSLTPAPSTLASSASLASHISDAQGRVLIAGGETPPKTVIPLHPSVTSPAAPSSPLCRSIPDSSRCSGSSSVVDPRTVGGVSSFTQQSQTSRERSGKSAGASESFSAPIPPVGINYCERCLSNAKGVDVSSGVGSNCHMPAVPSYGECRTRNHRQRQHQNRHKRSSRRRPRSADPIVSIVTSTRNAHQQIPHSPRANGGGACIQTNQIGSANFLQDVFAVDEDVTADTKISAAPKTQPLVAKRSCDNPTMSLPHRIGQIIAHLLYSGFAGRSALSHTGSPSTVAPTVPQGLTNLELNSGLTTAAPEETEHQLTYPPSPGVAPASDFCAGTNRADGQLQPTALRNSIMHDILSDGAGGGSQSTAFISWPLCPSATIGASRLVRRWRTFNEADVRRGRLHNDRLADVFGRRKQAAFDALMQHLSNPLQKVEGEADNCLFLLSVTQKMCAGTRSRRFLVHRRNACCPRCCAYSCLVRSERVAASVLTTERVDESVAWRLNNALTSAASKVAVNCWGTLSPSLCTPDFSLWRINRPFISHNHHQHSSESYHMVCKYCSCEINGHPPSLNEVTEVQIIDTGVSSCFFAQRDRRRSHSQSLISMTASESRLFRSFLSEPCLLLPERRHDAVRPSSPVGISIGCLSSSICSSGTCGSCLSLSSGHPVPSSTSDLHVPSVLAYSDSGGHLLDASNDSQTASFCEICDGSVSENFTAAITHRKRSISHSDREPQLGTNERKPSLSILENKAKTKNIPIMSPGKATLRHEYANFGVCPRANTLPLKRVGGMGKMAATESPTWRSNQKGTASFDRCDGTVQSALRGVLPNHADVSTSQDKSVVSSVPNSPPISYCNLPSTLLTASSSSSSASGGGLHGLRNNYGSSLCQPYLFEKIASSEAAFAYANVSALISSRQVPHPSSARREICTTSASLSSKKQRKAVPSPQLSTCSPPLLGASSGLQLPASELPTLRQSCGGTPTNLVPEEVRDPKRNYALVDLRPSPANSVFFSGDLNIYPICGSGATGSRTSYVSQTVRTQNSGGSLLSATTACTADETNSEPDSSASTLLGVPATTSNCNVAGLSTLTTVGNTMVSTTTASDATDGIVPAFRRRHSHSLSSALPDPPLNYVRVVTMPVSRPIQKNMSSMTPPLAPGAIHFSPSRESSLSRTACIKIGGDSALCVQLASSPPDLQVNYQPNTEENPSVVAYAEIDFVRTRALSSVNGNLDHLLSVNNRDNHGGAGCLHTKALPRTGFGLRNNTRSKRIISRGSRKKSNAACSGGQ